MSFCRCQAHWPDMREQVTFLQLALIRASRVEICTSGQGEFPDSPRVNTLEKTLMLGRLRGGGEGNDRGQNDWMPSTTQWTWAWVNSGKYWRPGKPGVLQTTESLRGMAEPLSSNHLAFRGCLKSKYDLWCCKNKIFLSRHFHNDSFKIWMLSFVSKLLPSSNKEKQVKLIKVKF